MTEKFIDRVKCFPILYDTLNHPSNRNLRKKDKKWQIIGDEFGIDCAAAKKKWKNLRDTYAKYLKSVNTNSGKKCYGHWQWAKNMSFFKPYIGTRRGLQYIIKEPKQIGSQNDDNSTDASYIGCDEVAVSTFDSNVVTKSSPVPCDESIADSIDPLNTPPSEDGDISPTEDLTDDYKPKKISEEMDELEHLFMGHAKSVKKLPQFRQTIIKMKVAQIIAEQELLQIGEMSRVN